MSALRRRARYFHEMALERVGLVPGALAPAAALLDGAAQISGVAREALEPGDPLLAGAHAVLDRDAGRIWYAAGRQAAGPRALFAQAHEYGHLRLHPHVRLDECLNDDTPEFYAASSGTAGAVQAVESYSPAERQETEANVFAAEFLLPGPALRYAWLHERRDSASIASSTGLSESCVLAQLAQSLLLPDAAEGPERPPPEISLDPSQIAAARAGAGPLLVDAGPGTGKTRTLIARVSHLVQALDAPPESILALTFSNRAAEEIRARLYTEIGHAATGIWIGTFHGFGFEILRKEGEFDAPPRLIETADAVALLEARYDSLDLDEYEYLHDPSLPFPDIIACIVRAKEALFTPDAYMAAALRQRDAAGRNPERQRAAARSIEIARVFAVYEEALRSNGMLDFSDLLARSIFLLESRPEVRARWQRTFSHVLADEYQDVNRACARLLQLIAGDGKGLWAVGDVRQAIYQFRGASPANLHAFESDFPGGRRLKLAVNYRSLPGIVDLLGNVASDLAQRPDQAGGSVLRDRKPPVPSGSEPADADFGWIADRRGSAEIAVAEADDMDAQADGISAEIRRFEADGYALMDQAVLCRTNGQILDLSRRLESRGIPTLFPGSLSSSQELRDLLAALSFACQGEPAALRRLAALESCDMPEPDLESLLAACRPAGAHSLMEEIPAGVELSEPGRQALARLRFELDPVARSADAWLALSRYLFQSGDYLRRLLVRDPAETLAARVSISALLGHAARSSALFRDERRPAVAFIHWMRARWACADDRGLRMPPEAHQANAVRMLTVHASKGLEFPVVFVPNLSEGQFPPRSQPSMAAPLDEVAEETGDGGEEWTFFVALSRARDHLVLSRARSRQGRELDPSSLLQRAQRALDAAGARRLCWTADPRPDPAEDVLQDAEPAALPEIAVSRLEEYRSCPRLYFYRRIAGIPEPEDRGPYAAFHEALNRALRWMAEPSPEGASRTLAGAVEVWDECAAELGLDVSRPIGRALRAGALRMIEARFGDGAAPAPFEERSLRADLRSGAVRLNCSALETTPDGGIRLVQHVRRRPRADDHVDPRLALIRLAGQQERPGARVRVTLEYLPDGSRRDVPASPRWEPGRIAKYESALNGIRQGLFAPNPDERRCARCPFLLCCPL